MDILQISLRFLFEDAYIMIPILWGIIQALKGFEAIKREWLPFILIILSVGITPMILGGYTPDHIGQALLVASVEMMLYQAGDKGWELLKNYKKNDEAEEEKNA